MGTCSSCHQLEYVLPGPTMVMSHNGNGNTVNLTATHVLKVEASVVNQDEISSELGKFWYYEITWDSK